MPKDMVAAMIQISTDENDIVLDPFAGSGTVLSQSAYMKRNYIGFELNMEYIEMFKSYMEKTFDAGRKEYELFNWYRRLGRRDISIFGKWKKDFIWEQTKLNFTDASRAMTIVMNIYQL